MRLTHRCSELPWGNCNNWWNQATCINPYERDTLSCWNEMYNSTHNETFCEIRNMSRVAITDLTDPIKEFWEWVHHSSLGVLGVNTSLLPVNYGSEYNTPLCESGEWGSHSSLGVIGESTSLLSVSSGSDYITPLWEFWESVHHSSLWVLGVSTLLLSRSEYITPLCEFWEWVHHSSLGVLEVSTSLLSGSCGSEYITPLKYDDALHNFVKYSLEEIR